MNHQSLGGDWQFRQAEADEWLPAQVPGGVHTDLLRLKRIPDPFVADNEKRVQWIAQTDWVYRRTFRVNANLLAQQRVFLVCDGLDTLAEITLNGELLGQTDNMFRQYRWEVKSLLRDAYQQFFYTTLPQWVAQEDPDTAYWPSSPSSNIPFYDPNGQEQGAAHYWDVWHGRQPFTAYRDQYPRFMSEFGFQALPPLETIRTYAAEADWNMTSYMMEHHQKNDSGNGLIIAQMTDTFRMPK